MCVCVLRALSRRRRALFSSFGAFFYLFLRRRVVPNDTVLKRETCWRERETIRFESNRFACFSLFLSLSLSLFPDDDDDDDDDDEHSM